MNLRWKKNIGPAGRVIRAIIGASLLVEAAISYCVIPDLLDRSSRRY